MQDGFVTIDATVGFEFNDGRIGLDFWGKNLTDQTITNIVFDTPLQPGSFSAFLEAPRTYGATLRVNFWLISERTDVSEHTSPDNLQGPFLGDPAFLLR